MATGRLGAADLAATTNTTLYTVPASKKATVNVYITNRTGSDIQFRLMHLDGALGTLANEDYLFYDHTAPANGVVRETGIPMTTGHVIAAYAAATGLSVQVAGHEEDA